MAKKSDINSNNMGMGPLKPGLDTGHFLDPQPDATRIYSDDDPMVYATCR